MDKINLDELDRRIVKSHSRGGTLTLGNVHVEALVKAVRAQLAWFAACDLHRAALTDGSSADETMRRHDSCLATMEALRESLTPFTR